MESVIKVVITGIIVALVLSVTRRLADRTVGILAGLPLTTLPALGWIAVDRGADLAARTAVASVFGCILVPVFAIAYERAARRWSAPRSLLAGVVAVATATLFASRMPTALWPAIALFAMGSGVALHILRAPGPPRRPISPAPASVRSIAASAGVAGVVSTIAAMLAAGTSPQWAGLVAGLPTVGLVTVVSQHSGRGRESVGPFLRGYVISTSGKAAFGTVFAWFAVSMGSTLAMLGAIVAGLLLCVVAVRLDDRAGPDWPRASTPARLGARLGDRPRFVWRAGAGRGSSGVAQSIGWLQALLVCRQVEVGPLHGCLAGKEQIHIEPRFSDHAPLTIEDDFTP